jgi:gliding motility-associated lipoprotein GldB
MIHIFSFKQRHFRYLSFLLLFALCSCHRDRKSVDVSNVKLNLEINRFEKDLFANPTQVKTQLGIVKNKYKAFYDLFTEGIIRVARPHDPLNDDRVTDFVKDVNIIELYKDVSTKYADISGIKADLENAFTHYKYYFPKKDMPKIYTFISGFNFTIVAADSTLGIGLDMYLGKDYKHYPELGYPMYKIRKMSPEYVAADCIRGWLQSEYELVDNSQISLLQQMIFNGKQWFMMDLMMPDAPDSIKTGFTAKQLEWCNKSEKGIWSFFIDRKLLYSTNQQEYVKYINDGPSTNGMPKESPAMLGCWVGWQIVKQYMDKNPKITLQQLLDDNDAQKILAQSRYKPKK